MSGPLNDTWTWDGTDWTQQFPVDVPPARSSPGLAYDGQRHVVVMFGGDAAGGSDDGVNAVPLTIVPLGDTWTWDGTDWTQKFPTPSPSARSSPGMAFHGATNRKVVLLFGGRESSTLFDGDTWQWNGSNWTNLPVTGPQARSGHRMEYDTDTQTVVLFGGFSNTVPFFNDTWTFDGRGTWTHQNPTSPPGLRCCGGMAHDQFRHRMLYFGGGTTNLVKLGDTWAWDGTNWSCLSSPSICST